MDVLALGAGVGFVADTALNYNCVRGRSATLCEEAFLARKVAMSRGPDVAQSL